METVSIVYHLRNKELTLDQLIEPSQELLTELADPETLNNAWIQAIDESGTPLECQPYSLSEFLDVIMKFYRPILSGKLVWLNTLESSLSFCTVDTKLEIRYWNGLSSHQIRAFLGVELISGLFYELNCTMDELLVSFQGLPWIEMNKDTWLQTILHWGKQFARLVTEVRNHLGDAMRVLLTDSQLDAIQEMDAFLGSFPNYESDIAGGLQTVPIA